MKTLLSLICLLLPLTVMAQDVELEPITAENADQIEQINIIGYGYVDDMAYTPDGEQIVLAGSLGLAFYDADLYERAPADRWTLPEPRVLALAFSSDGSLLATISGDRLWTRDATVTMRLWNPATREVYSEWTMPWMSSPYMIFSPDNSELAFYEWSFSRKGDDVLHWEVSDPATSLNWNRNNGAVSSRDGMRHTLTYGHQVLK